MSGSPDAYGELEAPISNTLHMVSICQGLTAGLANDIHGYGKMKFTAKEMANLIEKDIDNLVFAIHQAAGFARSLHQQYYTDEASV